MPHPNDILLARLAVARGLAPQAAVQAELDAEGEAPFLERLLAHGWLTVPQRDDLLAALAGGAMEQTVGPVAAHRSHPPSDASAGTLPGATGSARERIGRIGKYRIIEELGRGAMGVVYRAEDTELRRQVALKTLLLGRDPGAETLERFLREARTAATLAHPGIVPIHDMGVVDGLPFYAMGLVEGRTLEQELDAGGLPEPRDRVRVIADAARAVGHAHERRVVHRDLKPSNILIDAQGRVHVMDFGVAKRLDDRMRLTVTGEVLGTPLYMSPEQMNGESDRATPASDVYSLGAVLYEALSGATPHQGGGFAEMAARVLYEEAIPLRRRMPGVSPELETVVHKALDKAPGRRYPTAREFAEDLDRWLAGAPVLARPASSATRLWRRVARHRGVLVPAAAAGLLAASFLVVGRIGRARDFDAHVATGDALTAQGRPADARDEYRRALLLDENDEPTRDKLAHVEAELRRREGASLAAAEGAQRALAKGGLAQRVLARWMALAPVLAELEMRAYDSTLHPDEWVKQGDLLWARIEPFRAATPADPTSQATMKALCGWARILAGRLDEGQGWLQDAGKLDPEIPYPPVIEAFCVFCEYLNEDPLPAPSSDGTGIRFSFAAAESADRKALRVRMEELLARAAAATVWGEILAGEFRGVLEALQAVQAQDFAAAESALSRVLDTTGMPMFRDSLVFARAKVRCYRNDFAAALPDLEEVVAARPRHVPALHMLGLVSLGQAGEELRRSGNPFPSYAKALAALGAVARCFPDAIWAHVQIGIVSVQLAEARAAHGEDGGPDFERALAEHSTAMRLAPTEAQHVYNRGGVRMAMGKALQARGGDARDLMQRGIEDLDAAVRLEPKLAGSWEARGVAHYQFGAAIAQRGGDPRPEFAAALRDWEHIRRELDVHPLAPILAKLAAVHEDQAVAEQVRGNDPKADVNAAFAAYADWIREAPKDVEPLLARGRLQERISRNAEAIRDYEAALALRHDDARIPPLLEQARARWTATQAWAAPLDRGTQLLQNGDYAGSRVEYENALAAAGAEGARRWEFATAHYNLACIYALLAEGKTGPNAAPVPVAPEEAARCRDTAFGHLRQMFESGGKQIPQLRDDPDLAALHADPRWAEIIRGR